MTYESITHEMIQALSDEIEAIKEGGGGRQVPLQNGRKVGFAGGRFLYIFNLAFELAQTFNNFYRQCPVLQAEPDVRDYRLRLAAAARQAISNCLALLGIETPEVM